MAHFAKLDNNNIVTDVLVVNNAVLLNDDGTEENEQFGIDFLNNTFGQSNWVQTSYNGNFRKKYAGVGDTYDSVNNVFISPKPFNSWTLDENFDWQPPTPYPTDGQVYQWNEGAQTWDLIA